MRLLLPTLLAVSACGESFPISCGTHEGFHEIQMHTATCGSEARPIRLAKQIMVDSTFTNAKELEPALAKYNLQVREEEVWNASGEQITGMTHPMQKYIEVGNDFWSLLHEQIHAMRDERGFSINSEVQHLDWDELRYFQLSDYYVWQLTGEKFCNPYASVETLSGPMRLGLMSKGWDVEAWEEAACGAERVTDGGTP